MPSSPRLLRLAALFVSVTAAVGLASTAACVPTYGGCYATQSNFAVAPSEPCLSFTPDVCDAQDGYLTVVNKCTDDLTIVTGGGDAGASSAQTVAAGQTGNVYIEPFAASGSDTVDIPATLGTAPITISYVVTQN